MLAALQFLLVTAPVLVFGKRDNFRVFLREADAKMPLAERVVQAICNATELVQVWRGKLNPDLYLSRLWDKRLKAKQRSAAKASRCSFAFEWTAPRKRPTSTRQSSRAPNGGSGAPNLTYEPGQREPGERTAAGWAKGRPWWRGRTSPYALTSPKRRSPCERATSSSHSPVFQWCEDLQYSHRWL